MTSMQQLDEKNNRFTILCRHCGAWRALNKDKEQKCPICESPNIIAFTDEMYLEYQDFEDEVENSNNRISHALECMRKKYVYNDPDFSKEAFDQMLIKVEELRQKNIERAKKHPVHISATPKCPKCYSSDFEMVPRKWSLLTGFMTNKVDRVCRRCKKRF